MPGEQGRIYGNSKTEPPIWWMRSWVAVGSLWKKSPVRFGKLWRLAEMPFAVNER
jgi:hypothetical protein